MFDKVKSADNPTFNDVKENWDKLCRNCPRVLNLVEQDLKQKKKRTIAVVSNFLEDASDREVAELYLISFLVRDLLEVLTGPSSVQFTRPVG